MASDEQFKRLLLAANVLIDNHIDLGDCLVAESDDDDDYPTDADGDRWYHDWWELREAIRACEQADPETAEKWIAAAPDMLKALIQLTTEWERGREWISEDTIDQATRAIAKATSQQ
jgi:hypothetical protein